MQRTNVRSQSIVLLLCLVVATSVPLRISTSTPKPPAQPAHASSSNSSSSVYSGNIQTSRSSSSSSSSTAGRSLKLVQQSKSNCKQNPGEPLSQGITSCLNWQQQVGCAFLEAQGYVVGGVQSLVPDTLSGNFSVPGTCGSTAVSVAVKQQQLRYDAGGRFVLAVIAKGTGSSVYSLGRGANKGVISLQQQPSSVELCLSPPSEGSVGAQQTVAYTPRLAPGSVTWQLKKTVQLPPVFADGVVQMIQGDTVEAAWTLSATKTGNEAVFQGVLSGRISITNTRPVAVTVYGVLTAVKGGPSAVVNCGPTMPFQVPACTTVMCTFTANYPQPPAAGPYIATTTVQYQESNRVHIAVADVQTTFQVPKVAASMTSGAAKVPPGQAVVSDTQLPGQLLTYTGTGQQSYVTMLTCPTSGSVVTSATLLAATGQEVVASAHVQKNCHKLDVRLVDVSQPVVARWHWSVQQVASTARVGLRSASAIRDDFRRQVGATRSINTSAPLQLFGTAGQPGDDSLPTTEDVTYTVHVTRSLPKGADGKVAPFTLTGKVVVTNPSPTNAKLTGVTINIVDPGAQEPALNVAASCPLLAVASGQSLTCRWTATPTFNPIGGAVTASVRYAATRNGGGPSGDFVDFESALVTVGDASADTADETSDSLSTFGGTFSVPMAALGSVKRTLLQWASGMGSAAPAFNPGAFLNHVWGNTGANTIIARPQAATFASEAALPAERVYPGLYSAHAPTNSFAAPAPLTSLPGKQPAATQYAARSGPLLELQHGAVYASSVEPWERQAVVFGSQKAPAAPATAAAAAPTSAGGNKAPGSFWAASGNPSSSEGNGNGAAGAAPAAAVDSHKRVAAPGAAAAAGSFGISAEAAAVSAVSAAEPVGLLDDCADVSHELGFEPSLLPSRVVSGRKPTGRICSSSVYVYSVRYGPYESCSTSSKAAAAVRLLAVDTRRVRSTVTEVDINVRGCKPGLDAVVAAARPTADVSASWDMRMHAEHPQLHLQPGQVVNNSYTVSYNRQLVASAPRLFVIISLRNSGHSTPLIGDASYHVNVTCGAQTRVRSSAFACTSNKVAPGGSANCSFVVPLPCAAKGLLQAQLQLSTGQVVRTPVTEFAAPDLDQLVDMDASRSACVKVSYGGAGQKGKHKQGKLIAGAVPKGILCQPQTFSFTRQFGPYSKCGQATAHVSAGYVTAAGVARNEGALTGLDVSNCSSSRRGGSSSSQGGELLVQAGAGMPASSRMRQAKQQHGKTAAGRAAQATGTAATSSSSSSSNRSTPDPAEQPVRGACVHQPWFWKHCMLLDMPGEAACDVIITSLPGGQGPRTPFFPYRKSPAIRRTYRQLMVAPKKTGNKIVDLHFAAAKVFIAAQLNQYAGVVMPPLVRAAYVKLGREYFSFYDDRSAAQVLPAKPEVLQQVAAAAKVLADFTGGKLPGFSTCAAVKQQARHRRGL